MCGNKDWRCSWLVWRGCLSADCCCRRPSQRVKRRGAAARLLRRPLPMNRQRRRRLARLRLADADDCARRGTGKRLSPTPDLEPATNAVPSDAANSSGGRRNHHRARHDEARKSNRDHNDNRADEHPHESSSSGTGHYRACSCCQYSSAISWPRPGRCRTTLGNLPSCSALWRRRF